MIKLSTNIINIEANISQVFAYVSNMENYKNWYPGCVSIVSSNSLPHGTVGKTYLETLVFDEGNMDLEIEVHKSEKDRIFQTRGDLVGVLPQMTMQLVEDQGGCNLELTYHSRNPKLAANQEMLTELTNNIDDGAKQGLQTLKSLLESQVVSA